MSGNINPGVLLRILQRVDLELLDALALSRNNDLTAKLELARTRITILIQTIENLLSSASES